MKTRRRKIEELLWISGLHPATRFLHAATIGRQAAAARKKMRAFFGQFLKPGELVFDIGANMGAFSAVFASLGAKVVSLEPNMDCVRHIQLSYQVEKIDVIQAAAGQSNGLIVLNVSDDSDAESSVSQEWMETVEKDDKNRSGIWKRKCVVPVLTLDTLIAQFGMPFYIKIDVEGFEESVLAGLSAQPRVLSFEFHANFLPAAFRCLDASVFTDGSTFNLVRDAEWGYPANFESETWMTKDDLKAALLRLKDTSSQGDVFVRAGV
jgi:FkbM family methyltransferase